MAKLASSSTVSKRQKGSHPLPQQGCEGAGDVFHKYQMHSFLETVPHNPGVYLMRDIAGIVLYVGKARDLRKRLASYSRDPGELQPKIMVMLDKVVRIETMLTNTEKEALILEASLIKQHRPRYNVILRDDKNYPLIKVTVNEQWPRLLMTRQRIKDRARYFGPFSSASAMWETIRLLNRIFPLRRCNDRELKSRSRPCLNHQMKQCLAPCADKVSWADYQANVQNVIMVLEGRDRQLIADLTGKMNAASEIMDYEKAAEFRDAIAAICETTEKQIMVAEHFRDQDVFGFVRQGVTVAITIIFVRHGVVSGQRTFFIPETFGDDAEILSEVLSRYYEEGAFVPHDVLLPFVVESMEALVEWLTEMKNIKVNVTVPSRGDRRQLQRLATENAEQVLHEEGKRGRDWEALANAIEKTLHLERRPETIECLDISNTGGELSVGSLVRFEQGEKTPSGYRHYRIRTVDGPDDYASMAEVLARRFADLDAKDKAPLPDLLLIDGGRGQLGVAVQAVDAVGLLPLVELASIAKEREEEGEKLFRPGKKNPIMLPRHSPVLLFLMRIRDEAHHYGITFHRKLRNKQTISSQLSEIPGLGPARVKLLLSVLGNAKKVMESTENELAQIPGIGQKTARQIREYFDGKK